MPHNVNQDLYFKQLISRLINGSGTRISVPTDFAARQTKILELLDNDYTGIVKTIIEFMISTGSVNMNFVTDNSNLTKALQDWANHKLNAKISLDIPSGLKALTTQYMRERWTSSFIVLNIIWGKINDLILPSRMWFSDGGQMIVGGDDDTLNGKKYWLGSDENPVKSTDKHTILIRKPFNAWYVGYPTQYLVGKGVLYNAMLKKALITKQADVIEEMIPYILALRAGDATILAKNLMGDYQKQLEDVKEGLKQARRNQKYKTTDGDMILKGRYDLNLEHIMPNLTNVFNETIVKPVNNDMLCGLGLVELQGFSSDRQEAILNPKVLVEEILNGVADFHVLMEEVFDIVQEKNSSLHPKQMGSDIRLVPGVVKAFLTQDMRKLIKDYTNTGELAIEDSFEALPQGFDFEISKKRRQQEQDNGDEDLFFPRVILNQDSNTKSDTPLSRPPTPQEVPKKKKSAKAEVEDEESGEYLEAPYTKENYPSQLKNLPVGARNLWIRTFNAVYEETKDETKARQAAWHIVKGKYHKDGDKWVKNQATEELENE
ncbi:MAG: ChaB family protein [Candidatus Gracilibacteria bacterium]|nr:ChaB family protein [Candidatus Gracilibacteria bacterium]